MNKVTHLTKTAELHSQLAAAYREDAKHLKWIEELEGTIKHKEHMLRKHDAFVGSSRVDLQACKLEYSIVSPK